MVDAAAQVVEALLRANPAARVIATSREPLRAEGEWVYPVPPLAVPTEGSPDSEDPLCYGAVRLFVERARAAAPHFLSDPRATDAIGGICRRLDGIPLAIELAAARAATLGIDGLAARLDDRFGLLAGGHRSEMPRHQTLRATLDCARSQGALSWELRAATSLARLLSEPRRSADATALLQPVYDRFTEGFATADLKAAKALLDDLSSLEKVGAAWS